MIKTFIAGMLLGIGAAGAALYYVPVVDQFREESLIVVHPNHGNTESFHVNVPMDRIMIGAPGRANPLPPGLEWPEHDLLSGMRAELFKIRNDKEIVVGIASRIAANHPDSGDIVEWVLHLPARGSAYVAMPSKPAERGQRIGELQSGTREFSDLTGRVSERWVENTTMSDDAPAGRIELITAFVSTEYDDDAEVLSQ